MINKENKKNKLNTKESLQQNRRCKMMIHLISLREILIHIYACVYKKKRDNDNVDCSQRKLTLIMKMHFFFYFKVDWRTNPINNNTWLISLGS